MSQGGQAGGEAICAARIGVLTDQGTFAHVSASGRALGFAGAELALQVAYEHVSGLEDLLHRLASCCARLTGLLVDPELAAPDERSALLLAAHLRQLKRPIHVVLYAAPRATAMHAVRRLAARIDCALVVRGIDPLPTWHASATSSGGPREALQGLERLRPRFRAAWLAAIAESSDPTVKRIAALANVNRRTLERAHRDAGVCSPGRYIRSLGLDGDVGEEGD